MRTIQPHRRPTTPFLKSQRRWTADPLSLANDCRDAATTYSGERPFSFRRSGYPPPIEPPHDYSPITLQQIISPDHNSATQFVVSFPDYRETWACFKQHSKADRCPDTPPGKHPRSTNNTAVVKLSSRSTRVNGRPCLALLTSTQWPPSTNSKTTPLPIASVVPYLRPGTYTHTDIPHARGP